MSMSPLHAATRSLLKNEEVLAATIPADHADVFTRLAAGRPWAAAYVTTTSKANRNMLFAGWQKTFFENAGIEIFGSRRTGDHGTVAEFRSGSETVRCDVRRMSTACLSPRTRTTAIFKDDLQPGDAILLVHERDLVFRVEVVASASLS